jgi:hypothetical protein
MVWLRGVLMLISAVRTVCTTNVGHALHSCDAGKGTTKDADSLLRRLVTHNRLAQSICENGARSCGHQGTGDKGRTNQLPT